MRPEPSALFVYDETCRVPAALLARLTADDFARARWFPVALEGEKTVTAAAEQPHDPQLLATVGQVFPEYAVRLIPASPDCLRRLAADFAPSVTGAPVGVVRTNLAAWRNTMALWRTRLAC